MSWLFPTFLFGFWALALPILLHLLRRQPKRTFIFPSLRFLAVTQQQTERRHRVQRWIVLALRCLALALLVAAFARPFPGAKANGTRATVVVVDNSFSLQAGERWPALRQWAREQIGTPTTGDKIGLLLMAPRPTWIAPLNTDAASALPLLEKLTPGWEAARVEGALRLAADSLAAAPAQRREIIFLGDHQRVGWAGFNFENKLPPGVTLKFPALPKPIARQAALRAPTVTRTPTGFRAALSVQNFSTAQTRTLRVYRDGSTVARHQQALALGERATQTLQIDLPADGAADSAHFRFVLDEDDLPADDAAYAGWHAGAGDRVVLLDPSPNGSGADFLASALASTAELKPALQVLPIPTAPWPTQAVAVLRNDATFTGEAAARLQAFLRAGGAALIFVSGGQAQTTWLADVAGIKLRALKNDGPPLQLRDWAMDHPLVTALSTHSVSGLLGWEFRRAWALPVDAVDPLALWSGANSGAALGETNAGAGRMLLCGFGPDRRDSDWPVREVFVPFVHRAVSHLLGAQAGPTAKPAVVGEPLILPADSGSWRALEGPAATAAPLAVHSSVVPTAPGIFEFSNGSVKKIFAVNLSPTESDPASWSEGTPWLELASSKPVPRSAQVQISLGAVEAEQRSSLWWWLAAALALVLLAELGLANRTTR